uniref:Uncharacterized protein n=1 Tax=Anguilla anguilla TaxID=7936 RepID=A0A0E9S336_ANGAN
MLPSNCFLPSYQKISLIQNLQLVNQVLINHLSGLL